MYYRTILFLLIVCVAFCGCGPNQHLSGKITFPDGEPLSAGTVIFSKPGFVSRAAVKPDGSFNVGSLKEGDGIPAGTYKAYIIFAFAPVDPNDPSNEAMISLVEEKFTSEKTSPLEITIPGDKTFNIVVERPAVTEKK